MPRGSVDLGVDEGLTFTFRLSEIGETGRVQMPVAITGSWVHPATNKDIVITGSDLQTAKGNFLKKSNGEINVDYDHASEMPNLMGQPRPSAGRVVALRGPEPFTDSKGTSREILWGNYEPTPLARQMIHNREYRYISPCLQRERIDKATGEVQGITITTIALTNTPVLEEMPEIRLSEQGQLLICAENYLPKNEGGKMESENHGPSQTERITQRAKQKGIPLEKAFKEIVEEDRVAAAQAFQRLLAKDDPKSFGAQIAAGVRKMPGANDELTEMALLRSKQKGIPYELALWEVTRENPALATRSREEVMGVSLQPNSGRAGEELHEKVVALSEANGLDYETALRQVASENRALVDQSREEVMGVSLQPNSGRAGEELHEKVVALSEANGLDYKTALRQVARENPQLAQRAYDESLG